MDSIDAANRLARPSRSASRPSTRPASQVKRPRALPGRLGAVAAPIERLSVSAARVVFGCSRVMCESCGSSRMPYTAVWRGHRPYCSAEHEHEDLP